MSRWGRFFSECPCAADSDVSNRVGAGEEPYKYRFFNCGCGNVPALDVFVFCDDPSPFAFSSSSQLKVEAVSGAQ